ncbi:hypothetical protein RFI_10475 [Reticulomyxa filosa]|uniref:U-box domain-containing protein n=1 Tax=Reticulomyxa filosa TaxID=46433 RepID=X6NL67_RETFI|nr:hypothetical protein RFI_10475 [Reticulomyxa filosa]|eukprot:ETO26658.1 hypothetical protein RFI_10475 [Reticulomyxa filosa]
MSVQVEVIKNSTKLRQSFAIAPCILFKEEILVCGGYVTNSCYSYHILKEQYKYICSYPNSVQLYGHCILQLTHLQTNPNEIHLLSFGGQGKHEMKQTFSMTYRSVWECDNYNWSGSVSQAFNTWIPHSENTNIGKIEDDLRGARGLIGGRNNDLLFITYYPQNVEVIDLKTMKPLTGIQNNMIPKDEPKFGINYHCFVPLTMNNKKSINHFILFCRNTGLLIKYDEQNKTFNYEKLPICSDLTESKFYSFVYLHDLIFLFGGRNSKCRTNGVWKYSMKEKTWDQCGFTLPMKINASFAVLSADNTTVHFVGVMDKVGKRQKMHVSINVEQLFELKEERVKNENKKKMELERLYAIPTEKDRVSDETRENKMTIEIPKNLKEMKVEIEKLEQKLKEWEEEKRIELNERNWDDIWSYDGAFKQIENEHLIQIHHISSIVKTLIGYRASISTDMSNSSKDLKEKIATQQSIKKELDERYLEKTRLKKEADEAIIKYVECIKQYNQLCDIEAQILIHKQQKDQIVNIIQSIDTFNHQVLNRFDQLNNNLKYLMENNQKWINENWSELEKKWSKWNSRDIAIFIGHTLKYGMSLLQMSKKDWMDVFELGMFSEACLIHDLFVQIHNKYPIDGNQQSIPKEYLCPLSKSIMKDPVIALDGKTYDRSSIMNQYQNISNDSSLMMNGKFFEKIAVTAQICLLRKDGEEKLVCFQLIADFVKSNKQL